MIQFNTFTQQFVYHFIQKISFDLLLFLLGLNVFDRECKTMANLLKQIAFLTYSLLYFPYQVFLLDNQVDDSSTHTQDSHAPTNEEDDQRSYVFVLSSVENKEKPENADRYEKICVTMQGLVCDIMFPTTGTFVSTISFHNEKLNAHSNN